MRSPTITTYNFFLLDFFEKTLKNFIGCKSPARWRRLFENSHHSNHKDNHHLYKMENPYSILIVLQIHSINCITNEISLPPKDMAGKNSNTKKFTTTQHCKGTKNSSLCSFILFCASLGSKKHKQEQNKKDQSKTKNP